MNTKLVYSALIALLLVPLAFCTRSGREPSPAVSALRERIQAEFPATLPPPPIPENNPQTSRKVRLGEALFFDPNLSSCGTVACATCHLPELGFSDGQRVSDGCGGSTGRRNSNTIYNTAYMSHLFWDGRVQSLEQQALGPIVDPAEMANTWDNVIHYLSTGEHLVTGGQFSESARFYRAFFDEVFAGKISSSNVARALASYERTIVTRDAAFDRWMRGDNSALSKAQKRGALIFFGRGKCSECHQPPNFSDSDFHNVGAPRAGHEKGGMYPENGRICGGVPDNLDPGRAEIPFLRSSCSDLGKFRTPTLRNVELTAPYMHNGTFLTLEAVMQHYWNVGRGTTSALLGNLDKEVTLVQLTDMGGHPDDFVNLVEFLGALTGDQVQGPPGGIAPPRLD